MSRMVSNETTEKIGALERDLSRLIKAYELYFLGHEKLEPINLRKSVENMLRDLQRGHIPQAAMRFRLQTIASKVATYRSQWDRVVRQMEEGTYYRQLQKKALSEKFEIVDLIEKVNDHDDLYEQATDILARTSSSKNVSRERFSAYIDSTLNQLKTKYGHDNFKLDVVEKNGKARIVAKVIK